MANIRHWFPVIPTWNWYFSLTSACSHQFCVKSNGASHVDSIRSFTKLRFNLAASCKRLWLFVIKLLINLVVIKQEPSMNCCFIASELKPVGIHFQLLFALYGWLLVYGYYRHFWQIRIEHNSMKRIKHAVKRYFVHNKIGNGIYLHNKNVIMRYDI